MSFKKLYLALPILAALVMGCATQDNSGKKVEEAFLNPPETARPWVYWYWINENISKEGITRDLEAMAEAGIGAALIGNVTDGNIPIGNVPLLSEEWWDMMAFAVKEGKRVGVNIGMFNCPGWSQSGGPWVTEQETMRYLTSSELAVTGPQKLAHRFTDPKSPFQQVAVQAFRVPKTENDIVTIDNARFDAIGIDSYASLFDPGATNNAVIKSDEAQIFIITNEPRLVRSMQIYPASNIYGRYQLEYKDADGKMQTILDLPTDRWITELQTSFMTNPPTAESFTEVTSNEFRITFKGANKASISKIKLGAPARISKYIEKQLAKMAPIPYIKGDTYDWDASVEPGDPASMIDLATIVDLKGNIDADGLLTWDVPEGDWIILRSGMTPTGITNSPTMPIAMGPEIDKMSAEYAAKHFDAHVGKLLERLTPDERTAFRHVVADSYEKGAQNWTDGFGEDFQRTYGYDPYTFLPVLTGRVVGDADRSERFLWDVRRLVADRISSGYVGALRKKAEENGMRLWLENYGHWGFPGEFLNYGGASNDIGGEFWLSDPNLGAIECRCASSAGHIYGKDVISAESFTSAWTFNKMPRDFKTRGDWCVTEGINHFVFHLYIHQPYEQKPGINAWFGTDFNRHTTWYAHVSEYFDYIKRISAMLQQGSNVADVAYFIGEDAPKMTGTKDPAMPKGYDYDFINGEVLMMESTKVRSGRIVLGSGASYAILVLPDQNTMRPEILDKIAKLVNDGATILGPRPEKSPSGQGYPQSDINVQTRANEVWGEAGKGGVTENTYGKGRVFTGIDLKEAFGRIGLVEDVTIPEGFLYTHRREGTADVYFITNQEDKKQSDTFAFRVEGMQPELWDAVSGEMRDLENFTVKDGQTFIPLEFESSDSWLIVFRNKTSKKEGKGVNFPARETVQTVEGPWNVSFNPEMDAPANIEFAELTDWTTNSDPAIKYYSGEGVYTNAFNFSGDRSQPLYLDLGQVETMASVKLNGEELGVLWRYPYSLDVTSKLLDGANKLEVTVINHWWNRLVGDEQPDAAKTYTHGVTKTWNAKSELISAGLMGPVTIQTIQK